MKRLFFIVLMIAAMLLESKAFAAEVKKYAVFKTSEGDVLVEFFPEIAPQHTEQIGRLIQAGLYDGVPIHRIERGFVAQVNNVEWRSVPLTPDQKAIIKKIPAEFSDTLHVRGILSMAHADNDINSAESSFSFLLGPAPHLDGKYTIFAKVIHGLEVLDRLEKVPVDARHKPLENIQILSAVLVDKNALASLHLDLPPSESPESAP